MAIHALRGIAAEWYTPGSEEGEENPTRFKLKPLTPPQLESVMDLSATGNISIPLKNYGEVLKMGLVDWENFNDPEMDQPIKAGITNHHRIPSTIRIELGAEIISRSSLSGDQGKN